MVEDSSVDNVFSPSKATSLIVTKAPLTTLIEPVLNLLPLKFKVTFLLIIKFSDKSDGISIIAQVSASLIASWTVSYILPLIVM